MIKNIIFDMGQVLIHWHPTMHISHFELTKQEQELLIKELFCNIEWPRLDRGTMSEEEAIASVNHRLPEKYHPMVEDVITGWWKHPLHPVEGMEEVIRELKENGYGIYLLSNAADCLRKYFHRIPGAEYFDALMVSAEEHYLKPQHEIYETLFEKFQLKPEECFFIDDAHYNIEGAYQCGMQGAVFHGDVAELRYNLKMAGVQIDA